jgi:hypothetical protein
MWRCPPREAPPGQSLPGDPALGTAGRGPRQAVPGSAGRRQHPRPTGGTVARDRVFLSARARKHPGPSRPRNGRSWSTPDGPGLGRETPASAPDWRDRGPGPGFPIRESTKASRSVPPSERPVVVHARRSRARPGDASIRARLAEPWPGTGFSYPREHESLPVRPALGTAGRGPRQAVPSPAGGTPASAPHWRDRGPGPGFPIRESTKASRSVPPSERPVVVHARRSRARPGRRQHPRPTGGTVARDRVFLSARARKHPSPSRPRNGRSWSTPDGPGPGRGDGPSWRPRKRTRIEWIDTGPFAGSGFGTVPGRGGRAPPAP